MEQATGSTLAAPAAHEASGRGQAAAHSGSGAGQSAPHAAHVAQLGTARLPTQPAGGAGLPAPHPNGGGERGGGRRGGDRGRGRGRGRKRGFKQSRQARKRARQEEERSRAAARQCGVCGSADAKYKCPACRMPFCCVACSKKHKEVQCTPVKPQAAAPPPAQRRRKTLFEQDEERKVVVLSAAQRASLDGDAEVQRMAADARVQALMHDILSAPQPREALDAAMHNADVVEFCDRILRAVGFHDEEECDGGS